MSGNAFSPRTALALALFGIVSFLLLLWMVGTGMGEGGPGAVGPHARGKGLNGYAALYDYLGKRGFDTSTAQSRGALKQGGVLILTPLHSADPKELDKVVREHREVGPTIVILPKWRAVPLPQKSLQVKKGFVKLVEPDTPDWPGFYDDLSLQRGALRTGSAPGAWQSSGLTGAVPYPDKVIFGDGENLIPLVIGEGTERVLAGYMSDGGDYPALRGLAMIYNEELPEEPEKTFPVIQVFDADLFNNWGMNRPENAALAEKLIVAALDGAPRKVVFDLTFDGYGRSPNLLGMAFTPPFLAATLCLVLAAMVALWRAYRRFGPPLAEVREVAFGKRALVGNSAGLIHRARRLHLLGTPYADAALGRLSRALALPARLSHQQAEAAIDRALLARGDTGPTFSFAAAQLRAASKPGDLLRGARQIHHIERTLTR